MQVGVYELGGKGWCWSAGGTSGQLEHRAGTVMDGDRLTYRGVCAGAWPLLRCDACGRLRCFEKLGEERRIRSQCFANTLRCRLLI